MTSRDKDKELGWFMRVGAVAGSNGNGRGVVCMVVSTSIVPTGWAVREKLQTKDDSSRASR